MYLASKTSRHTIFIFIFGMECLTTGRTQIILNLLERIIFGHQYIVHVLPESLSSCETSTSNTQGSWGIFTPFRGFEYEIHSGFLPMLITFGMQSSLGILFPRGPRIKNSKWIFNQLMTGSRFKFYKTNVANSHRG